MELVHLLERIHAKTLVHAGRVTEESSQCRFENDTEIKCPISHSLMNDRITTCFTNNQISPLHDYDWYEESSVAGKLQWFTIPVRLLAETHELFINKTNRDIREIFKSQNNYIRNFKILKYVLAFWISILT